MINEPVNQRHMSDNPGASGHMTTQSRPPGLAAKTAERTSLGHRFQRALTGGPNRRFPGLHPSPGGAASLSPFLNRRLGISYSCHSRAPGRPSTVTDVDEPGMVTLSAQQAQVGDVALTATLTDDDADYLTKSMLPSGSGNSPRPRMDRGLQIVTPRLPIHAAGTCRRTSTCG